MSQERKGPAPSRGSLNDPAALSIPSRKSGSGGGPPSLPQLEITDGSGNNSSMANNPESLHNDGNHNHKSGL